MKAGQKVTYINKVIGSLKGYVIHSNKINTMVEFSDEVYGKFKKSVPTKELYLHTKELYLHT